MTDRARIEAFLEGVGSGRNRDLAVELLTNVAGLVEEDTDRLDLKITNTTLKDLRMAFRVFAPYRDIPKVTMFGSARTAEDDPLYAQARELAAALSARGWMVITGAGPGIMAAGMEGAGRDMSFGINTRLPFEQGANAFITGDPKLVEMKYFFTRKLMLMKESDGFVILPGGFGTLDEAFELLTLTQTGKAEPCPIVLMNRPGGRYWHTWESFLRDEVAERGFIDVDDLVLFRVTDDVDAACGEITGFYRNYHSRRYVGDLLVIRLKARPTAAEVAALNASFADVVVRGSIELVDPLPPEVAGRDHLALPRLAFRFDQFHHARLRSMIDTLNGLDSAPALVGVGEGSREAVAGGLPMEADVRARAAEEGEEEP